MTAAETVLLIAQLILALVSFITFIDYLRHRDRPRLDITLMFATLGIPSLLLLIQDLTGQQDSILGLFILPLLFAHPYLMLRLVRHFEPLAGWIARAAQAGFIVSVVIMLGTSLLAGDSDLISLAILAPFTLAILYFVIVESYAALKFIRGAFRTSGLTRHRLRFLGAGSAFLAAIFLVLILFIFLSAVSITTTDTLVSGLTGLLAILVALSYLLGLTPPLWLRRYWQLSELQFFLDKMNQLAVDQPAQQLLDLLSRAAVRVTGGSVGTAAFWQPATKDFVLHPPAEFETLAALHIPDGGHIGRSWHQQTPVMLQEPADFGPGDQQAAAQVNATALAAIPIQSGDQPFCLLLVFMPYGPLFPGDDIALLNLFASRVSLALAFVPLLEHERQLVRELQEKTAELQEAHDTLEQRVRERTLELAAVNQEIQQFTYVVSHDLRSPLINLKGFVKELDVSLKDVNALRPRLLPHLNQADRATYLQALDQDIPEATDYINTAATRMDSLVRALLDLSRLGRRQPDLEQINMDQMVADTIKTLAHVIEEKGVTVLTDPLPQVLADQLAMEQIMSNLLTNAVNYLDPERPGFIKISATPNHDTITYHIEDNGRGIAPEDRNKVFAPFRRAGEQDVPGEGMGLAYVQTLVRRHNGRITFDSQPNQGTTFHLTLPN